MKFKFDPSLSFQQEAIDAIVKVFEGQPPQAAVLESPSSELFSQKGNAVLLTNEEMLANVQRIQERNHIEKATAWQGREFSIEMETGTGKTYVYLRTIFELNKHYGFLKFIIVVPSIAVREGVLKSMGVMKPHFQTLYNKVPFSHFVYDSKRLSEVRDFSQDEQIQIMIINIQAFVKDMPANHDSEPSAEALKKLNVIHRENDRLSGQKPIEFIQAARPFVIIDEPQSVDTTPKAQNAIKRLQPAATFRYSATHRNLYNLLYKLDPIQAYDLRLVKRIEVASVRSEEDFNEAYVKLLKTDNKHGIKAQVAIHLEKTKGPQTAKVWVKQGDDLFAKSRGRKAYEEGCIVRNIDCTPGQEGLELNSGRWLSPGQALGGVGDEIMQAQIRETIEQHLQKEKMLQTRGIKVLSLFFIDKVAHYRLYHEDGSTALGKIGQWFEDAFCQLTAKPCYKDLIPFHVSRVHDGYFSQDKHHHAKDTRGNTQLDEQTYHLIMRNKEKLLDDREPLRFIFTHSALREGWDNPNVFQICTLNETRSEEKKRQEIGRGMRLPVNSEGERVHDENVNRLTVIANESYKEFARTLQKELEQDCKIQFGKVEKIAFAHLLRERPDGSEEELGQAASVKIWQELVKNGYLDETGKITDWYDPKNPHFDLKISHEFSELRTEIMDEINKKIFENRIVNVRESRKLQFQKEVYLSEDFVALWERIKQRTRYRVDFATDKFIEEATQRLQKLDDIPARRIFTTHVALSMTDAGVAANTMLQDKFVESQTPIKSLPDMLDCLQKETSLTRHTLVQILKNSGQLENFKTNPEQFIKEAAQKICHVLQDLMVEGIVYEKMEGQHWEMCRLEQEAENGIVRYLNKLYAVQQTKKSLFDCIEWESMVEKKFAQDLDSNEHVKLFLKLPAWFQIETPVGSYNPDWAFVTQRDEKLYFVRETKSTQNPQKRRPEENQKISCAEKHFAALDVDYDVVTKLSDVRF